MRNALKLSILLTVAAISVNAELKKKFLRPASTFIEVESESFATANILQEQTTNEAAAIPNTITFDTGTQKGIGTSTAVGYRLRQTATRDNTIAGAYNRGSAVIEQVIINFAF